MTRLSDEKVCREYMGQMRWGGSPFCPHCNSTKPYKLKDGKTYRCSDKTCKKDFTVTVGTVFENSKVPLSTWIAATYVISAHKKGISSLQLGRDLGITQKTAWFVLLCGLCAYLEDYKYSSAEFYETGEDEFGIMTYWMAWYCCW